MPVYEFYCEDCHMIFNFFSRRIDTEKRPACPRCGRPELERRVSIFAISRNREEKDDDPFSNMDEDKMERAMMELASEAEGIDEEDPRQAARLMKRLFDATGLEMGSGMEEAIRRMEAGEDPEKIEEELGDILEAEDPFSQVTAKKGLKALRRRYCRPRVDDTLYEL